MQIRDTFLQCHDKGALHTSIKALLSDKRDCCSFLLPPPCLLQNKIEVEEDEIFVNLIYEIFLQLQSSSPYTLGIYNITSHHNNLVFIILLWSEA